MVTNNLAMIALSNEIQEFQRQISPHRINCYSTIPNRYGYLLFGKTRRFEYRGVFFIYNCKLNKLSTFLQIVMANILH